MSPTTQSLHCPGLEAIPHEHPQHQDHGPYSGASFGHEITSTTKEKSPVSQPKVLGLPVKVFWVVMVGFVVILAGGIGGGLAGGLAASHQPSTSQSEPTTTIPPESTSETMATVTSSGVIPSSTVPSNLRVGTVATDGGCPELNGTIYTPREGNGKPYSNAIL